MLHIGHLSQALVSAAALDHVLWASLELAFTFQIPLWIISQDKANPKYWCIHMASEPPSSKVGSVHLHANALDPVHLHASNATSNWKYGPRWASETEFIYRDDEIAPIAGSDLNIHDVDQRNNTVWLAQTQHVSRRLHEEFPRFIPYVPNEPSPDADKQAIPDSEPGKASETQQASLVSWVKATCFIHDTHHCIPTKILQAPARIFTEAVNTVVVVLSWQCCAVDHRFVAKDLL